MPWIVVLGKGTWSFGHQKFPPGKYQVSEEIAKAAETSGKRILVMQGEPQIISGKGPGPLTPEDVKLGVTDGVRLWEAPPPAPEELDAYEIPHEYGCTYCVERYPSAAARDRHEEMAHAVPE